MRFGLALLASVPLFVWQVGCAHPATREECVEIFNRTAELELREQNITEPALVEERTKAFMEARGEALIEKCQGQHITKSALECVRRAQTSQAVNDCLY
ncbi:MAG: hypothetical protein U0271_15460 [Polyangiaceae bacterium]